MNWSCARILIKELEVKNAEAETLRASLASIVGTFEFSEIIQHILDQIQRVVPYDSASVWRLEKNMQVLIGARNMPPEFSAIGFEYPLDEQNHALRLFSGELPYLISHDVQSEFASFRLPPHTYINSWLGVPMRVRGKIIGLIALDGRDTHHFNEHHKKARFVNSPGCESRIHLFVFHFFLTGGDPKASPEAAESQWCEFLPHLPSCKKRVFS